VYIRFSPTQLRIEGILSSLKSEGFEILHYGREIPIIEHKTTYVELVKALLLLTIGIAMKLSTILHVSIIYEALLWISIPIVVMFSYNLIKRGLKALIRLSPTMESLIALTIVIGYIYGIGSYIFGMHRLVEALPIVLGFVFLGHYIEKRIRFKASTSLKEQLSKLLPSTVSIVKNNEIKEVPWSEVRQGNIVQVRTGERVPVDGTVIDGEAYVDESVITGESKPVHKKERDFIYAGSLVVSGFIWLK